MFDLLRYLEFFLKSTNQHGIHSPFVYNFITKCMYKKSSYYKHFKLPYEDGVFSNKKTAGNIKKILYYFNLQTVRIYSNDSKNKLCDDLQKDKHLIYINTESEKLINFNFPPNSKAVLYVDEIKKSKKRRMQWDNLIQSNQVTVSIDFYHFGMLFFRASQEKEHFNIRS